MSQPHTTVADPGAVPPGGTTVPRASWIFFVVLGVIVILVSTVGQFTSTPETSEVVRDGNWLVATFGTGMGLLTIALALIPFRRGQAWSGLALAYYPVFFATHVIVFGTWIPDAVLFLLSALALGVAARSLSPRSV